MSWFTGSKRAAQSPEVKRKNSGHQTPITKIRSSQRRREKYKERIARLTEALKSSPLFLIGLVAVFLIISILIAVSKRFLSPSQQVVVHPFELSSDLAKDLKTSGNAISDIVSDDANEIVIEGGQFAGVSAGSTSAHFGAIPKTVHIPVKTSIPLTIKGISLDDAIQIYDWLRYKQVIISGDIYATDSTHAYVRMRIEGSENDGSWFTPFNPSVPLEETLKAESIRAMLRINPELVGRMYLKNHDVPNALTTFAAWANMKPLNPLPYYFLAYIYYLDRSHEGILGIPRDDELLDSQLMARQATQIAGYQNICSHFAGHVRCLWFKLKDGLHGNPTPSVSNRAKSSLADDDLDSGQYTRAYQQYSDLVKMYPADTNLQINLGVAAEGQGVLEKDNAKKLEKFQEALHRFQLAEIESPDNPLVERDIGVELTKIGNNDAAVNYEETALLLRPSYFQALNMAVLLLNYERRHAQAADLCRTFFVLASPDKKAFAQTIYGKHDSTTWSDTKVQCAHSFTASNQLWMSGQWLAFAEDVNTLAKASTSDKSDAEDLDANSSQNHAHASSVPTRKKDLSHTGPNKVRASSLHPSNSYRRIERPCHARLKPTLHLKQMQAATPSRTALRVAMRRAAHQLYDAPPLVLDDPIAIPILGSEYLPEVHKTATKLHKPFSVALRAFLVARSRYAEDSLAHAAANGVTQYVLLGAGLDTFAHRNPHAQLHVFEVDHPATQQWKRELLEASALPTPANLTYTHVDFEHETLPEQLLASGFNPQTPTFFAWLGVVPYLTLPAFRATLRFIAAQPTGSGVVLDYGQPRSALPFFEQLAHDSLASRVQLAGEPFQLFFTPSEIAAELTSFHNIEDLGSPEINSRYFSNRTDNLKVLGSAGHLLSAWR